MALKNMIKVGDQVTFGPKGKPRENRGKVIKCNPKTCRVQTRKGQFDVTYNLVHKPAKKKAAPKKKAASKKNPARPKRLGGRYQRMVAREAEDDWGVEESMQFGETRPHPMDEHTTRRLPRKAKKRNPPKRAPKKRAKRNPGYPSWLSKQTKRDLRKLENALITLSKTPGAVAKDAKKKLTQVRREISRR